ncbi:MAG: hypothetical protein F6K55_26930 [Moorea sp. SIO4A3]|nr:hypothetical protein [Moorena sp. SIO4A3]
MQRGLGGSPHERLHQDKAGSALPTWQALLVFRSPTPHTPHPTPHTPHPTPSKAFKAVCHLVRKYTLFCISY